MLAVETIAKIRRAYFVDVKSIKQICRELRASRNTVHKVVRSGATEFTYDRTTQPRPKIDLWLSDLDSMLAENGRRSKRERLTVIRIYEELRNRGDGGGYNAIRRYAAGWSKAAQEASASAYAPLSFDPCEAYQFDWSHEIVILDGVTVTVKVAHVRLCQSRMPFVRGYPRETQKMVFDAHDRAFAFIGSACARGIYDSGNSPPLVRGQWTRRHPWIPGDFLGLRSVLLHVADHSIEPVTDIEVTEIQVADLLEAFARTPRLATAVLWAASRDEAMVVEHLVDVGRRNAAERITHFLLELGARLFPIGVGNRTGFDCPHTQYRLADALGLSDVHVNRVLRKLREWGMVTFRDGFVTFDYYA